MKLFTIKATSVIAGFKVNLDPYQHVRLGEPEEDETSLWIPLAVKEWLGTERRIFSASTKLAGAKQTLLISPESEKLDGRFEDSALIIADIRGAVGSETAWSTARTAPRNCLMYGRQMTSVFCPLCGAEVVDGRHPYTGEFVDYGRFPPHGVSIVKKGYVKKKGGPSKPPWARVYLLRMDPGSVFRVHRGCDNACERIIRWTGDAMELGTPSELLEMRPE